VLDALIVLAYLACVVFLGLWAARRGHDGLSDFVLAGRRLTLPLFVATLVPSFYGGVLGVGEFTWENGLSNWLVMGLPYYVFAAVYAVALAGRVRAAEGLTIPDHFERAYGPRLAAWSGLLVFLLANPADELLMIGLLLSRAIGVPVAAAMALAGAASFALLRRGGLRSDVWANALQFVVMFAGFAVILPGALSRAGGLGGLSAALPAGHLSLRGGMSGWRILSWWLIAVWTLVDPSFHQRCASAESGATARAGILWSIAFWFLFDAMTTTAGLCSRALMPGLRAPLLAYPSLADALLPAGLRGLFYAALASSILAALQTKTLLAGVSLGKDAAARILSLGERAQQSLARWALLAALALGWALALWIPSVVDLWYAVGTTIIPALLLPLLGTYFPRMRVSARFAALSSAAGLALSGGFWLAGRFLGAPPWGIEPMFPGLAASALVWAVGLSRALA